MLADCVVLALIVLVASASWVGRLGFYYDDWTFLARLSFPVRQSPVESFRYLYALGDEGLQMRPLNILYLIGAHRAFGLNPVGYHLAAAVIFAIAAIISYLAFRAWRLARTTSFAIVAVYSTLPHFSAAHFWIANHQASISIALAALAFLATARGLRAQAGHQLAWRLLGLGAMILSALAYEPVIPLFVVLSVLVCWRARAPGTASKLGAGTWTLMASAAMPAAALVAVVLYKAALQTRIRSHFEFLHHFAPVAAHDLSEAFRFDFAWLLNAGVSIVHLQRQYPADVTAIAAALIVFATVAAWLNYIFDADDGEAASPRYSAILVLIGPPIFWIGNVFFLANMQQRFLMTGAENRVYVVSAVGAATVVVGVAGLVSGTMRPRVRAMRWTYCGAIAAVCMAGSLTLSSLSAPWSAAYGDELVILTTIQRQMPKPPPKAVVMLDGLCADKASWRLLDWAYFDAAPSDFSGALRILYERGDLRGEVLKPPSQFGQFEVAIPAQDGAARYRYRPGLFVFNMATHTLVELTDAAAAWRYAGARWPHPGGGCENADRPMVGTRLSSRIARSMRRHTSTSKPEGAS